MFNLFNLPAADGKNHQYGTLCSWEARRAQGMLCSALERNGLQLLSFWTQEFSNELPVANLSNTKEIESRSEQVQKQSVRENGKEIEPFL